MENDLAKEPETGSFRERLNALPPAAKALIIIGVILLLAAIANIDDGGSSSPRPRSVAPDPPSGPALVVYEVTIEGYDSRVVGASFSPRASLTYENDTGGTEQHEVRLPWNETYQGFEGGDFLYISAQNEGETGELRCVVKINGVVKYQSTSSGAYSICTASGSLK